MVRASLKFLMICMLLGGASLMAATPAATQEAPLAEVIFYVH